MSAATSQDHHPVSHINRIKEKNGQIKRTCRNRGLSSSDRAEDSNRTMYGAPIFSINPATQATSLHRAAELLDRRGVTELLSAHLDPCAQNSFGETPLVKALVTLAEDRGRSEGAVEVLVEASACCINLADNQVSKGAANTQFKLSYAFCKLLRQ